MRLWSIDLRSPPSSFWQVDCSGRCEKRPVLYATVLTHTGHQPLGEIVPATNLQAFGATKW